MGDYYYPEAYGGGKIDFSSLGDIGKAVGGAVGDYKQSQHIKDAWTAAGGDYNKAVSALYQMGDVNAAAKLAKINDLNGNGIFGTPLYGKDANGKPVVGALNRNGGVSWYGAEGNVVPSKGVRFLNRGTEFAPVENLTGQAPSDVSPVPINNAQKAIDTQKGQAAGTAQTNLGTVVDNATFGLKYLDDVISKAPETSALGDSAIGGYVAQINRAIPATEARGFQNLLDQVNSGAFLAAFDTLRGGGQISNAEGEKATAAKSRMNTATNRTDFIAAAKDFRDVVAAGIERAQKGAQGDFSPTQATPPAPGALVDGYRFRGGNPNDPNNWVKAK